MGVSVADILKHSEFDINNIDRVSFSKVKRDIALVEYNPAWPQHFEYYKENIISALGPVATIVSHVGSSSVPGLSAKDVIDIDLTVRDVLDESAYVSLLEGAGWQFKFRESAWHEHRYFTREEPYPSNLHVWGPDCPEVVRHGIFREWLMKNPADKELYEQAKRRAVVATAKTDGNVMEYNSHKENTIREILTRAFRSLGYLKEDENVAWDQKPESKD